MIEPNMATMLCFVLTDAAIDTNALQELWHDTVQTSFNSISVDGDESTSDTAVLVSSGRVPGTDMGEFQQALQELCRGLAEDIVRNGEGTGHVLRVAVDGFPGTDADARRLGRQVVNSPLVKCAMAGNDPNIGRLAGAVGSFLGEYCGQESEDDEILRNRMTLSLGGQVIFRNGKFDLDGAATEERLSAHIAAAQYDCHSDYPPHQRCVEIGIAFGDDGGSAVVLGSDLTAEYVAINADYRS